ncbi:MAG: hypothetical protein WDW36_001104 [Sanguina aurantia]
MGGREGRAGKDAWREVAALKHALEQERADQLAHVEASRRAFDVQKSAAGKRYQVALKEATHRHEADMAKAKRRLREAQAAVSSLTEQLTETAFRTHTPSHQPHQQHPQHPPHAQQPQQHTSSAFPLLSPPCAAASVPGQSAHMHATSLGAGVGGVAGSMIDRGLMDSIAALRQRQQQYLGALAARS